MRSDRIGRNALAVVLLFLLACATPEKRVKVLAFFFDGVPGAEPVEQTVTPEELAAMTPQEAERRREAQRKKAEPVRMDQSIHKPYQERQCDRCHDRSSATFLRVSKRELCFTCHKQERFEGKYVHGPVAVRHCLTCHLPHSSVQKALLREAGAALCFQCHNEVEVRNVRDHATVTECLTCHDPHTSDHPLFLRHQDATTGS